MDEKDFDFLKRVETLHVQSCGCSVCSGPDKSETAVYELPVDYSPKRKKYLYVLLVSGISFIVVEE